MALKSLEDNFPKVSEMAFKLMRLHSNQHGMIQTGSYKLAHMIYEYAPDELKTRMLCYNGNVEKQEIIDKLEEKENLVLVGPTLLEGIDLPGDLCKFIIVMKVPWPSLGSVVTKKKMKLFPK